MKKLLTLTIMGVMFLGGAAFAQDDAPVRDRDGQHRDHFRIPRVVRDDADIQESVDAYRLARAEFRTALQDLRARLADATDAQKDGIKGEVRELMQGHRELQRDFRKKVRDIVRQLRSDRATDSGEGS